MLGKLKSLLGGGGGPLASAAGAAAWFKGLAEVDAPARLARYVALVAPDQLMPDVDAGHEAAILWLDEQLSPAFRFVREHYVQNPRMPKPMEEAAWNAIHRYAETQIRVLLRLIQAERYEEQPPASRALLLVLVLRYVAVLAKWRYFRFEPLPSPHWLTAHQMQRLAEMADIEALPVTLYPNVAPEVSSCTDEYLQLLLLGTVSASGFGVRQLDMVDQWLHVWSKGIGLDRRFVAERHHYAVDLGKSEGAERIAEPLESSSVRYIDSRELLQQVDAVRQALRNGEPGRADMPDSIRLPGAQELLNQLYGYWTNTVAAKKRDTERKQVNKLLDVALGFKRVAALIKSDNIAQQGGPQTVDVDYDEMLDMRLYGFVSQRTREKQAAATRLSVEAAKEDIPFESWLVQNESAGGFGAVLPFTREGDDLRPGGLLAVRIDDDDNWHVALLRRVQLRENKQFYVGIQVLGLDPLVATYREAQSHHVPHAGREGVIAVDVRAPKPVIYVDIGIDGQPTRSLILQAEDFAVDKQLDLHLEGKTYPVILLRVIEKGLDWVWAEVRSAIGG